MQYFMSLHKSVSESYHCHFFTHQKKKNAELMLRAKILALLQLKRSFRFSCELKIERKWKAFTTNLFYSSAISRHAVTSKLCMRIYIRKSLSSTNQNCIYDACIRIPFSLLLHNVQLQELT